MAGLKEVSSPAPPDVIRIKLVFLGLEHTNVAMRSVLMVPPFGMINVGSPVVGGDGVFMGSITLGGELLDSVLYLRSLYKWAEG